jgi:hypothetical protein
MTTPLMLRERNILKREGKMLFLQLTHRGAFARLQAEGGLFGIAFCTVLGDVMRRFCRWSLIATGVALAGCATLNADSPPEAKQKVVAERAQARWDLLIKGDVDGAYQYLSTGSKAAVSGAVYKVKIKPGIWRGAKVDKVACEAEICKVQMMVTYDFGRMKGVETPIPETWIIENGTAGYVYH